MVQRGDLIIPVYLNQRVVFDLVAKLEGGTAEVTQVSQSHEHSGRVSGEVASTVGLGRALSMVLRIDLSGNAAAAGVNGQTKVSTGGQVKVPTLTDQPDSELLDWHAAEVFRG